MEICPFEEVWTMWFYSSNWSVYVSNVNMSLVIHGSLRLWIRGLNSEWADFLLKIFQIGNLFGLQLLSEFCAHFVGQEDYLISRIFDEWKSLRAFQPECTFIHSNTKYQIISRVKYAILLYGLGEGLPLLSRGHITSLVK